MNNQIAKGRGEGLTPLEPGLSPKPQGSFAIKATANSNINFKNVFILADQAL